MTTSDKSRLTTTELKFSLTNDTINAQIVNTDTNVFTFSGVGGIAPVTLTNIATPLVPSDAANKSYVDEAINGLKWKEPVHVCTYSLGDISLSGEQTIDAHGLTAGDRVLVADQADGIENGIYLVASGAWTRSSDLAVGTSAAGVATFCQQGTVNADLAFVCTNNTGDAVVGTDSLVFIPFGSINPVVPGAPVNSLQYNNAGDFGGVSSWTSNGTSTLSAGTGASLTFADGATAVFGGGSDLTIQHDTTNSSITNTTGNLILDSAVTVITGTLSAGDTTVASINVTGNAQIAGASTLASLVVTGTSNLVGKLTAGDSTLASLGVTGNTVLSNSLDVLGKTILQGTLSAGASTLASLDVTGSTVLAATTVSSLTVSGASVLSATTVSSLAVTGASSIGSLSAGASTLTSLDVSGASVLSATTVSSLVVTGTSNLVGKLTAGDSTLASLGVTGNTVLSNSLDVLGKTTLQGTLSAGASTLASLDVTGSTVLAATTVSSLAVTGASSIGSLSAGASTLASLAVDGEVTMSSLVVGDASMNSLVVNNLDINGMATLEALAVTLDMQVNGTTQSTTTTDGALVVLGGVGVGKNLNVGGNVSLETNANLYLGSETQTSLSFNGTVTRLAVTSGITTINTTDFYIEDTVSGNYLQFNPTLEGDLLIQGTNGYFFYDGQAGGNLEISGNITALSPNGTSTISSTLDSTTTGDGAFVVLGGVGIAMNLNVGGKLNAGASTLASLNVSGASVLSATTVASLAVTGASSIGSLSATSTTLVSLAVDGEVTMSSLVVGDASMNSLVVNNLDINGMATLEALAVTLDMQVNGTTQSTTTTDGALVVLGGVGVGKNLNVGGTFTAGASTLTSLAVTGASSIGSLSAGSSTVASLDVSGASVLSATTVSSLAVTGTSSIGSLSAGASTLTSLVVSGTSVLSATTVSSLAVTGASSIGSLNAGETTLVSLAVGSASMSSLVVGDASMNSLVITNLEINGMATLEALAVTLDMQVNGTTQSTDVSSGSLVVMGGVAVQQNLNVGGTFGVGTYGQTSLVTSGINVDKDPDNLPASVTFGINFGFENAGIFQVAATSYAGYMQFDPDGKILTVYDTIGTTNINATGATSLASLSATSTLDVLGASVLSTLSADATTLASLAVVGASSIGSLSATSTTLISLAVTGTSSIGSLSATSTTLVSLAVDGEVTMSSLVVGDASMNSLVVNNLDINGMATLEALAVTLDMQVNGTTQSITTTDGALVVLGGVGVGKNLNVGGTFTAGATTVASLDVTGVLVAGSSTVASLDVTGVLVAGSSTVASLDVTGVLVAGSSTVASLDVSGASVLSATTITSLAVTGASSIGSLSAGASTLTSLAVTGASSIGSLSAGSSTLTSLAVTGASSIGSLSAGASTLTSLNVSGDSAFVGSSTFSSLTVTGVEYIKSNADATDVSSGSLIVSGGVGIAKNVYVGNDVYATAFNATSDAILKTNIEHLTGSLDQLKRVEGYQYNWKDQNMGEDIQYGVLAQQLEEAGLGHLVAKKGTHKSVNYMGLIPMLIEAVKELSDKLDTKKDLF